MAGFIQEKTLEKNSIVPIDFRHALCVGETGCGKTTSFILPNISSRIKKSHGMLIVDIKGNLHSQVKVLARAYNVLDKVYEIGVPWGSKINLFKGITKSLFINTLKDINEDSKDPFWMNAAVGVAGNIFDILSLHENIKDLLNNKKTIHFPYSIDIPSFEKILDSFYFFKGFIDDVNCLAFELSAKKLALLHKDGLSEQDIHLIYQFITEIKDINDKLKSFYDDIDQSAPAAGAGGVFFVLKNTISLFREDGLDGEVELKTMLEKGSIVIIRADTYSDQIMEVMMNILYKRLLVRNNSRAITLFVDEFSRSISEENIPYVDLFREMRVELIASMQNISQLENKLGEQKADEFLGNILHNYEYADHRINSLDIFEYLHNGTKYKAKPIFLKERTMQITQILWQNIRGISLEKNWIYHRALMNKKSIILNINTKDEKYHYRLLKRDKAIDKELGLVLTQII